MALVLCFSLAALVLTDSLAESEIEKKTRECAQQARPEVEQERKQAEEKAQQTLDKEAIAAVDETTKAVKSIAENKKDEALATIERAIGKVNVLLARNPATALIPVSTAVEVIEAAPLDPETIRARAKAAEDAVEDKDYPTARVLLDGLTSEIRVRTSHLPLATYPTALKEAARLIDQNKSTEARNILLTALHTLVEIDHVTPLPIALAQAAINEAQALREKDKAKARQLLALARNELNRAKELGYAGKDPTYSAIDKSIANIEKQLRGTEDTASTFAKLKESVSNFFNKFSDTRRPA